MNKTIKELRREVALDAAIKISTFPVSAEAIIKKLKKLKLIYQLQ